MIQVKEQEPVACNECHKAKPGVYITVGRHTIQLCLDCAENLTSFVQYTVYRMMDKQED